MSDDQFDEDYFMRGRQTGKSLYKDYRWMPDLTVPMVERIIDHLGITKNETVIDFGCARGYVVKAFRLLGYEAFGVDVSEWAIENADPEVKQYCKLASDSPIDTWANIEWVITKDVLEHIPQVVYTITDLMDAVTKGVFAVVPLSKFDGSEYVIKSYEKDVTHVQRHQLVTWVGMFLRPGWRVEASYRVCGIKDNYYKSGWEKGNGFITSRRVEDEDRPQEPTDLSA